MQPHFGLALGVYLRLKLLLKVLQIIVQTSHKRGVVNLLRIAHEQF